MADRFALPAGIAAKFANDPAPIGGYMTWVGKDMAPGVGPDGKPAILKPRVTLTGAPGNEPKADAFMGGRIINVMKNQPSIALGGTHVPLPPGIDRQELVAMAFVLKPGQEVQLFDYGPNAVIVSEASGEMVTEIGANGEKIPAKRLLSGALEEGSAERVVVLIPAAAVDEVRGGMVPASDMMYLQSKIAEYNNPAGKQPKLTQMKVYPELQAAITEVETAMTKDFETRKEDKNAKPGYTDAEILGFSTALYDKYREAKLVSKARPASAKMGVLETFNEKTKTAHEAMLDALKKNGAIREEDGNIINNKTNEIIAPKTTALEKPQDKALAAVDGMKDELAKALAMGEARIQLPDTLTGALRRPGVDIVR